MADVALIYRRPATLIHDISLDATISETHTSSSQVTDHPVEKGANIVDHVRREPDGLVLEGIVSNTPLSSEQMRRYVQAGGVELESSAFEDAPRGVLGYAERAYERLRELMDLETVITVVTGLRTYDNMVLQALSVPVDKQTGDALRFSATFKQVRIVSNKLTTVDTRVPGGKKRAKLGPKATADASPKQKENASWATQITGIGEVAEGF